MRYLKDSEKVALVCGARRISYHELIGRAQWYGEQAAFGAGERVAIYAENTPEWAVAFYSVWHRHGIPVPIDFMAPAEEVAYILDDCEPSVVWCSAKTEGVLREALGLAKRARPQLLRLDAVEGYSDRGGELDFGENDEKDIGVIIYTSGTTGTPKGVMLTFRNLWVNMQAVMDVGIYREEERVLVLLPLHHVLPLQATLLVTLTNHATCVFATAMSSDAILAALQENQVTVLVGVPRLFTLFHGAIMAKIRASWIARLLFGICALARSWRLSRLVFKAVQAKFGGAMRYMPCGGAAIDDQVVKDFRTLGFEILPGYGMSETAPIISFPRPGKVRLGSVGQLSNCNKVRIQDGEITVKGENVMKGYYRRPEETAAMFDAEGWLHTGDLGYLDQDGYLFITGRKKEIIVLPNGKNINPEEVETHLMRHGGGLVAECAAVASGNGLKALVVPDLKRVRERRILNVEETILDEVVEPYNVGAAPYKRILQIALFTEPLPRTRLGKLRRHLLGQFVERQANRKERPTAEPAPLTPEYRLVEECLRPLVGDQPVTPDAHFELDLSLDSLGKVEFLAALSENCGVKLEETALVDYPTPRLLAAHLAEGARAAEAAPTHSAVSWSEVLRSRTPVALPYACWTHRLYAGIVYGLLRCLGPVRCSGRENLPQGRPCIIAPNHQSYLDAAYLSGCLDAASFRRTCFYATAKHVGGRLAGFARRHNIITMDMNGDIRQSLQTLAAALRDGRNVVVFPEGTRTLDGTLAPFRNAFAILAKELDVPIVPVAIDGACRVLPRGCFFPRPFRPVRLAILPPIVPCPDDTYATLAAKTADAIRQALGKH